MVFHQSLKEHPPARGIRAFRGLFEALYIAAEPLDFAARVLNNRTDYPPIRLRRRSGALRQMEMAPRVTCTVRCRHVGNLGLLTE